MEKCQHETVASGLLCVYLQLGQLVLCLSRRLESRCANARHQEETCTYVQHAPTIAEKAKRPESARDSKPIRLWVKLAAQTAAGVRRVNQFLAPRKNPTATAPRKYPNSAG
jgi:hypothetical protein